ncbi:unnamed protein product [Calicophoron daubneyi]|uniref:SCP domain-containing protein n=1 Tax=Calicophoron daubneyi TaxID=300641 RepID=A0AAV2TDV6_CALDB
MPDEFNEEALDAHNEYRAAHGSPLLVYDEELAESAQQRATEMLKSGKVSALDTDKCGENVAYKWTNGKTTLSGKQLTDIWYEEIKYHDFDGQHQNKSSNFTQLIWKGTKNAGFGIAISADGHSVFAVGHYSPAGNVEDQFAENVFREGEIPEGEEEEEETKVEKKQKKEKKKEKPPKEPKKSKEDKKREMEEKKREKEEQKKMKEEMKRQKKEAKKKL